MRAGLRLRLLLVLGALLLVAFVPLFYAVATYTSVALRGAREAHARALGRAVAAHVAEVARRRAGEDLMPLLRAEVGSEGLQAIGVYDRRGRSLGRAGEPTAVDLLPSEIEPGREEMRETRTARGRALFVAVPGGEHSVLVVVRTDDDSARLAPLLRLVGLYTLVVAAALLVATYFVLTRLIVKPLDALAHAAESVASGTRRLAVPRTSVRELSELGVSLRTMTERLLAEEEKLRAKVDEVERATTSLKEAQRSLVRSERLASVGKLAAGLAHEIGNPIAAIIGLQDLLLAGGLSEDETRDFLTRMRKETDRVHGILRDLLAFARPAGSPARDAESPGSVEAAVHDTVALLMPHPELREVDLSLDLHPELPLVAISRERLVQVVLNLVLNAASAVGKGGHVRIRAEPSALGVRLIVEDDGPGIDPRVEAELFEPFVTTKEVGKGTGLGLAVCRGLIEGAGGTITLDKSPERTSNETLRKQETEGRASGVTGARFGGARFLIELPRATS